ncbi:MAG TPA: nucleotide exchange factor GrpE [Thermoclostridium sp.]|nr:nucleotide exchange factor GrpE [Thermoclostridium sp.]
MNQKDVEEKKKEESISIENDEIEVNVKNDIDIEESNESIEAISVEDDNSQVQNAEVIAELKNQIQRIAAEFDNYKKRTQKEKDRIYVSSVVDVVSSFLPVMDNVGRALKASEGSNEGIREGVLMIERQIKEVLSCIGVKPIEAEGQKFDPKFHEAVMHVDDENYGENEIAEEFLTGYIYKDDIVIRHSVVKVVN